MLQIYIKIHNNKNDIPPVSWAYLRLAQLYNLLNKQTMKEKYYHLAYQSSDL